MFKGKIRLLQVSVYIALICCLLIGVLASAGAANAATTESLIANHSFESGLNSWSTSENPAISIQSGWSPDGGGDKRLNFWLASDYKADASQALTGLENGAYELSAWIASGGGFNASYMYTKDNGEDEVKVNIPVSSSWTQIRLPVVVSDGKLTLGFHADGPGNTWMAVDLVTLVKTQEEDTKGEDIANRGFEVGLDSWDVAGDEDASFTEKPGYKSVFSLKHSSSQPYTTTTSQTISNLEEGYYTLTAWTQNSGGQKASYLFANGNGTSETRTPLPVTSEWTKVTVRGIHVTTGQVKIGLFSDAYADNWALMDSVELVKDDKQHRLLKGGDVSAITYVESQGGKFYDRDGRERDVFQILKENGHDIVRLRLYNDPGKGHGDGKYYVPAGIMDKDDILKIAKRVKDAGLQIQLSFHYSDYWSNGGMQLIPHEWQEQIDGLSDDAAKVDKLEQLLYDYTLDVMQAMKDQGTTPEFVSLGNEMHGGLLFPYGRATTSTWGALAKFLTAGINAVKAVSPDTKVILHLDDAGNFEKYETFYDKVEELGVPYDIIGPSYYPFWTNKDVKTIVEFLNYMSEKYNKDIMIMETGFPWNPTTYSGSTGQLYHNGPYPMEMSSPEGQKNFMNEVFNGLKSVENGRVIGDLYWDPIFIHAPGVGWAYREADDGVEDNAIDNTTLFDFDGKALPVFDAYLHNADGTVNGMISGVVQGTEGNSIAGANIQLDMNGTVIHTKADLNGNYLFPDVPAGTSYTLTASTPGYTGATANVTMVVQGETTKTHFSLKGGAIAGKVTDDQGKPVSDVNVSVTLDGIEFSSSTDEAGQYRISDMPAGDNYTVKAEKPGYAADTRSGINVTIGNTVSNVNLEVVLNSGTIAGRVVDRANTPIASATVKVTVDGKTFTGVSNEEGDYSILNVPAGNNYTVIAVKENYISGSIEQVSVQIGKTTENVHFQLDPNVGTITGNVTDSQGKTVAGAKVTVTSNGKTFNTTTDASGKYSLSGVLGGNGYLVTASKDGYIDGVRSDVSVTAQQTTRGVDLRLATEVPIVNGGFETQGADRYTIPGWTIDGTDQSAYSQQHSSVKEGQFLLTNYMDGAYISDVAQTVTGLADGDYVLSAWFYNGGGQKEYYMYAKSGTNEVKLNIPTTGNMTKLSLNAKVTGGQLTFGFYADANAGDWMLVDDVKLGYQGVAQAEQPPVNPQPGNPPSSGTDPSGSQEIPQLGSPSSNGNNSSGTNSGSTIRYETKPDSTGVAKVTVTAADIQGIVAAGESVITLKVKLADGTKKVEVDFPWPSLDSKKKIDFVKVDTEFAIVSIRPSLLTKSDGTAAANVQLSVTKVDIATLPENVKEQLNGREVFDFNLSVDGVKISEFKNNEIQVTVPYSLKPGENPNKVIIFEITDDSGKMTVLKNGKYDQTTSRLLFQPKHFSKYVASYVDLSFADLSKVAWARDSIEALGARGAIQGSGNGLFQPDAQVTRAEFLQMLMSSLDIIDKVSKAPYHDVQKEDWYADAVGSAKNLGIVSGLPGGKFGPNDPVSRQDMALMVFRAAKAMNINLPIKAAEADFRDEQAIGAYAAEAVSLLAKAGILGGMGNGDFFPKAASSRAQAAVIIYRLFSLQT
ncbi:glycosyl hydrolase 53 family protein [Paenibacillus illinoisensis]|uniref:glycosyl hydrolase 53 family protein n=1 Tax=Paenibacillus illinoisensis TaxID=59845 RepID=UPI003CE7CEAA